MADETVLLIGETPEHGPNRVVHAIADVPRIALHAGALEPMWTRA